jgi:class 3 adenylate cyclase
VASHRLKAVQEGIMIFSLQKRFLVFLLVPVVLILLASGIASFLYARSYLLDEWKTTSKLRLAWTAHQIQMRLNSKRELLDLIVKAEKAPDASIIQAYLSRELSAMPGVRFVDIQSVSSPAQKPAEASAETDGQSRQTLKEVPAAALQDMPRRRMEGQGMGMMGMGPGSPMAGMAGMMRRSGGALSFDESHNFLSMSESFGGTADSPEKRIVVTISFQSFMKGILEAGQWKDSYACLVKSDGRFLAHTDPFMKKSGKFGDSGDPLEKKVLEEMKTKDFGTVFGEGRPPIKVIGFYKVPTTEWYLLLVSKGSGILAPVVRFRSTYMLAGVLCILCVGMIIHWNTRPIARSIARISKAAEEVENGNFSLELTEDRSDEIGQLKRRFNQMIRGLKKRDLIEQTFGRYVDKKIAQELMSKPEALNLGGEKHVVTILAADLRGFTPLAEKLEPEQVIKLLNRHFARMIPVIETYDGIIVDFYGDSILVFFNGMESDVRAGVASAVNCAFEMQRKVVAATEENVREGLPRLAMGIGIHTGEVIVGNIGTETRAKYGIVGSAVNETDRIQSCAQGGSVIVSENTVAFLPDSVEVGPKCQACLKGLDGTRDLYELRKKNQTGSLSHEESS